MDSRTVGVVGCGTMGSGIALAAARSGYRVVVVEQTENLVTAGIERIRHFLGESVRRGKLTAAETVDTLANILGTTAWADLSPCAVVVEAVFEEMAAKQEIMRKLSQVLDPDSLVGTNTSCLSVTAIAAAYQKPDRVVGLHFFNPAQLMKLVEVIRGVETAPEAFEEAYDFAKSLGKEPVRTKDSPGFLVNRLFIPYANQVIQAYDDGLSSREELDGAVESGLGYPMGGLKLVDLIGLDVHLHASEALYAELREHAYAPPPLVRRMVHAGRLGRKAGRGFYEYGREG